jgi:hypothetical protein
MDSTLQSLGLPRKTIGINVTQIGLDDVRASPTALTSLQRCAVTTCLGRIRIPADSRRPSAVSRAASTLSVLAWLFVSHAHRTTRCSFGDRIDCVSDFEVEMTQVCAVCKPFYFCFLAPEDSMHQGANRTSTSSAPT